MQTPSEAERELPLPHDPLQVVKTTTDTLEYTNCIALVDHVFCTSYLQSEGVEDRGMATWLELGNTMETAHSLVPEPFTMACKEGSSSQFPDPYLSILFFFHASRKVLENDPA